MFKLDCVVYNNNINRFKTMHGENLEMIVLLLKWKY